MRTRITLLTENMLIDTVATLNLLRCDLCAVDFVTTCIRISSTVYSCRSINVTKWGRDAHSIHRAWPQKVKKQVNPDIITILS